MQIGAPDVAFPRLNAFSYWLYVFGALIAMSGFFTPGGAAAFGWTAYVPLSGVQHSPGVGGDLWIMGLAVSGLGTILAAVNMITTVICMRCPGMTMWRLPIFTWNILITSILVLIAFPILTAALLGLAADRHFGSHVLDPANGGAILYQHLFWFFGHPEVYIVAIPFFGIVTEVIPVFSRKPVFGYRGMVFATLGIAALSSAVWAHHMFATGAVLLPFFSLMSFLIAIPTGIKFFNWIGTMWRGQITFETPMLFACGFLVTFLFGGLTGVMLASPAIDFHVTDSYFVVAHFHYVLFGTIVFATYSGIYFWFPKMTGRFLDERLGRLHFWTTFVGFHLTFLIQHWLGNIGMPRRYPDYLPTDGFTALNMISTIGSFVLGASAPPFVWNVVEILAVRRDYDDGRPVGVRQLPRVGDQFPPAAAQLHLAAAGPVRAAGVRTAPPTHGRQVADRGAPAPRLGTTARGRVRPAPVHRTCLEASGRDEHMSHAAARRDGPPAGPALPAPRSGSNPVRGATKVRGRTRPTQVDGHRKEVRASCRRRWDCRNRRPGGWCRRRAGLRHCSTSSRGGSGSARTASRSTPTWAAG